MPELPEVETIRRTLELYVKNKTIQSVTVRYGKIIKTPDDAQAFSHLLAGQTIHYLKRKGKFLLFYLDDYVLVSHLRMEGKYRLVSDDTPVDKHTHVLFHFSDARSLRYHDVRKFGTMHLFPIGEELTQKPLIQLAPDPFESTYNLEEFKTKLKNTSRVIKAVLLDQTVIAGLGNIYVDEVLFLSQVHPMQGASQLTDIEIEKIYTQSKIVLEKAVKVGGTTIKSYVDSQGEMGMFQQSLYAYGQTNAPCKKCGTAIEKLKVAGRGTHICPRCQGGKI